MASLAEIDRIELSDRSRWKTVRFGDVAQQVKVTVEPDTSGLERYIAGEHVDTDDLHIRRWGTIGDGYLGPAFHRKFKAGQILYGSRRTYLRKIAVADFDGVCANTTFVIEPKGDDIVPELLPFIMQSEGFTEHSIRNSKGSVNPYINWKDLAVYEFALPPKEEQRRIAELLWSVDSTVQSHLKAIAAGEVSTRTLANELFSRPASDQDGAERVFTLAQVVSHASDGPFGSKLKTEHYASHGARVVRLQNVGDGYFADDDKAFIPDDYSKELRRYSLEPEDILVAGLGDETYHVGRTCLVPRQIIPAIHKADCFCLRPKHDQVDAKFLMRALNSPFCRRQILQLAQGTTRLRINVSNLKTVLVPVPNKEQQAYINRILDQAEHGETELNTRLTATKELSVRLRERLLKR